jgi:ribA/ribD-fused uncharacterized protein
MSDLMFDEAPVNGKIKYTKGDWRTYAIHDDKNIKGFFGDYQWLSNFHISPVNYSGLLYPSSECAYQASKVQKEYRHNFQTCTPYQSKKLWKNYPLVDKSAKEWDNRKYEVMEIIVFNKFINEELKQKLLSTGDKYLEETNHWKDSFYGVDINLGGQNQLGKILMKIRDFWRIKND